MSRQIQRIDRPLLRKRSVVEQPVVETASESVNQHCRLATLALFQVTHAMATHVSKLRHKIVGRGFTPRRIEQWEPRIRELGEERLVDGVIAVIVRPVANLLLGPAGGVDDGVGR